MARQPRDIRLQTRDARRKLAVRHEPYWHELRRGLHLGYRKGGSGGVWWLREFRNGRYAKRRLGIADDELDANATAVLSWSDALAVALGEQRPTAHAPAPYTVFDALDDYFAHRAAKSPSASLEIDRSKAKAAIAPKLGESRVAALTTRELLRWRDGLVSASEDREAMRRAQATANRNWTVLRAALNHAYATGRVPADEAWRRIKPFRNVDRARTRFLSVAESKRILNAMPADFRGLARGALYTGLRLGELLALRVAHVADRAGARPSFEGRPAADGSVERRGL